MRLEKREAKRLYQDLERQGQQLADVEQRRFVIVRDDEVVYKLLAYADLKKAHRSRIVKRLNPKQQTERPDNANESTG